MIRATCPHCQLAQEFPDERAGLDVRCGWCGEPLTVGGPDAEFVPDGEPATPEPFGVFAARLVGGLFAVVASLLFLFALIGLPVLDFGFGWRVADTHPTEGFWLVLIVAYGFRWVADRLLPTPSDSHANAV